MPNLKKPSDHVVFDFASKALACRHCGALQPVALPMSVDVLVELTNAYLDSHRACEAHVEQSTAGAA